MPAFWLHVIQPIHKLMKPSVRGIKVWNQFRRETGFLIERAEVSEKRKYLLQVSRRHVGAGSSTLNGIELPRPTHRLGKNFQTVPWNTIGMTMKAGK